MQNFEVAAEATGVALNSAGSAARENDRHMESLAAHISALQSTFQQLSTQVIDSNLAKSLLDIANAFLQVLNTPIGTFITQIALLGSVFWGGSGLISAMKILPNLLSKAGGSLTLFGTTLKVTTPQFYLIAAAIVAVVEGIEWLVSAYREAHPTFEMIQEDITELSSVLETNQTRLDELLQTPWADRTTAIQAEIDKIREENEELREQLELKQTELAQAWNEETAEGTGYGIVGFWGNGQSSQGVLQGTSYEGQPLVFSTQEKALEIAEQLSKESSEFGDLWEKNWIRIDEVNTELTKTERLEQNISEFQQLHNLYLEKGGKLTADQKARMMELGEQIRDSFLELEDLNVGDALENAGLNTIYAQAAGIVEVFNNLNAKNRALNDGFQLTIEQFEQLKKLNPEVAQSVVQTGDAFYIEAEALLNCADASDEYKRTVIQNNIDTAKSTLETVDRQIVALEKMSEAYSLSWLAGSLESLYANRKDLEDTIAYYEELLSNIGKDSGSGVSGITEAEKTLTDVLKEQLEILDHQGFLLEKNGADSQKLINIYKQAQAEIHRVAEEYRRQGYEETSAEIRELQELWWGYADEIKSVYDEIERAQEEAAEKAEREWEESLQNQIDDLQKQADAWETAFNVVANKAQEEIDALEEQKDAVKEYYDSRIQALQDQNDELERQIQLEQAAMNLAQAESQQLLVYKDGRFQYVQNEQAISNAQVELERLEREEALRQEVANLEKLKDQAVNSIDQQIEYWEKYKEEWASVVSDYQEQQDILLAEQVLGIQLEGENWELRLSNLQSYVDQYLAIMSQLNSAQATLSAGYGASSGISSGVGGGGGGGGISSSRPSGSYAHIDGIGDVPVNIVGGKTQTQGLPVGTIVYPAGGGAWEITGGSGTANDPYTSKPFGASGTTTSSSSSKRPSSSSSSSSSKKPGSGTASGSSIDSVNRTLLSGGKVGNLYLKGNAQGTLGSEGGLRLVGENGPEIRVLNQGDGILPAEATRNLMQWAQFSPIEKAIDKTNQFFFDKLILPNATDLFSLQEELKRFNQFSFQH